MASLLLPTLVLVGIVMSRPAAAATEITVTNLQQLQSLTAGGHRLLADVRLEVTVCSTTRTEVGAVLVSDPTGVEILQFDTPAPPLEPGDQIRVTAPHCWLRPHDTGVELSAVPVVNDDGHHPRRLASGEINLSAGYHPLRLEWFNSLFDYGLEFTFSGPEIPLQKVPVTAYWHLPTNALDARADFSPGLQVAAYEGFWEAVPNFTLLPSVAAGILPDLNLGFCPHPEYIGLRFNGFFRAPRDGLYQFQLNSDDGSLLFLDEQDPVIERVGRAGPPAPLEVRAGQAVPESGRGHWVTLEGRVNYLAKIGLGLQMELRSGTQAVAVRLLDAAGIEPAGLLHARIRVSGLGRNSLTLEQQPVLGQLLVVGTADLHILEPCPQTGQPPGLLTSAEQVQRLSRDEASQRLPVRLRGVVTSTATRDYGNLSLQDDTRGIFINISKISSNLVPVLGELWEATGYTMPGDFAPTIMAESLKFLGPGQLPEPARPTWNQLNNGSLDVQWVEIQGVVATVATNELGLLLPEGRLRVRLDLQDEAFLQRFLNSHVRIRGTLFASWDAETHEVRPGLIRILDSTLNVESPAPRDVFDAPRKTVRELLHFDVRDTAFPRYKVGGQVVYADARQFYLMDGKSGLCVLPAGASEVQLGDLVEAVGYPEIRGLAPVLREAVYRKTGHAPLPPAPQVSRADALQATNDATRVQLTGKLLGCHAEVGSLVLELQSGTALFVARLPHDGLDQPDWRPGSLLAVTGVCAGQIRQPTPGRALEAFELLVNSPADIAVLSQPSWWTLSRMLGLVALLLFVLLLALAWITQLRRQVEQRTRLLHREIREREAAERQRALEAERSRIARDLHDDLGSSLTEIGVLASRGARNAGGKDEKNPGLFRDISHKARSLIGALDVIVWAVDPEENSLQSLADYLSGYTGDYLANADIACRFRIPVALPAATLDGRVRHDLFLAIKETLHNIVQHARATEVEFQVAVVPTGLEITITDNGCGFATGLSDGHGLKNLPARLAQMGGRCEVTSQINQGTRVTIALPLPALAPVKLLEA